MLPLEYARRLEEAATVLADLMDEGIDVEKVRAARKILTRLDQIQLTREQQDLIDPANAGFRGFIVTGPTPR